MVYNCRVSLWFRLKKQATQLNLVVFASQKYAYCPYKIGQPKPSRTCIIFDLKLWKILIIFRSFWPVVSRLSFCSVSLELDVAKIATIRHNYSLASVFYVTFWKHIDRDVHLIDYPEQNSRFVNAWTVSILPYQERFVEFSFVYALRWNEVINCRDCSLISL